MIKRVSIYKFLVGLMLLSLLLPAGIAGATETAADESASDAKLTVHKFEREPGVAIGDEGDGSVGQAGDVPADAKKLPGVEFTFTQTQAYDAATDKWTDVVDGATYVEITDADGEIVLDNLPLGRYKVQETDGPAHVNLNTDEYFVDIPMTNLDRETVNYDVHIYPKNETIRGAVELTKRDGDSEQALEGVTFTLHNGDGSIVQEGLTTDANGKIQVDGLAYGDYYFTETATVDGYVLGSNKVDFSIENSGSIDENGEHEGEVVEVNVNNFVEPGIEKEVNVDAINRGEDVTYSLTSTLPGDIAEYEQYVITDELDDRLAYVDGSWSVSGIDADKLDFTQNGQTLTWEINDFPAFVDVSEIAITFDATIDEDAPANEVINNKAQIEFENKHGNDGDKETPDVPVVPTAGTLTLIKQDGDTEGVLAGAEFEVRDADGNVVASGTTDENGLIDFGELDYGDYTIHETKAPEGYRKLINPIDVTVNADDNEHTLTVDNFKNGWDLPKTGGIGTVLFTLIGLTFMGAALGLYFRRRREIV